MPFFDIREEPDYQEFLEYNSNIGGELQSIRT